MYFDSVLSYLATFINDISLMNLSNETSRPSFYISSLSFVACFSLVFLVPTSVNNPFSNSIFLFLTVNKLRLVTPFLLGLQR